MPEYNVYLQLNISSIQIEANTYDEVKSKVELLNYENLNEYLSKYGKFGSVVYEIWEKEGDIFLRCPRCFGRLRYLDAIRQQKIHLNKEGEFNEEVSNSIIKCKNNEIRVKEHNTLQALIIYVNSHVDIIIS